MAVGYESSLLSEFLPIYYKRLFPFKTLVQWLSYGQKPSALFWQREFALILKDDVYLRYQSFADQSELEKEMCSKVPEKLDIGAVFNYRPKDHKKFRDFDARQRELVFDIDLTDYDDIRTCCSGGSMCKKCWRFMAIAVNVIDTVLKEHFAFKHRLWLYSGRRGVHCWIVDANARKLTIAGRSAVANYLSVVSGGEHQAKKVKALPTRRATIPHPLLQTAYDIIINGSQFEKLITEQGWLDDQEHWAPILKLCQDEDVRRAVENDMKNMDTVQKRYKALKIRFDKKERLRYMDKMNGTNAKDLPPLPKDRSKWFLMEFVLQYAYPRLDINVSTGINHLLKSPFCVHPKTGKIAVPFNAKLVDKFDVDNVPRIDRLIGELSELREQDAGPNRKAIDYKKTSLAPFVETFESFVNGVLKGLDKDNDAESMDF